MNETNKTLFVVCTHGNEPIGKQAVEELLGRTSFPRNFEYVIANPQALEKGVRFIDVDLNRSAPGNSDSKLYEARRAYEVLQECKKFDTVIDIHGTDARSGLFVIVTNLTKENIAFARTVPIQRVVIWQSVSGSLTGPITKFVSRGVEIECGPQEDPKVLRELQDVLLALTKKSSSPAADFAQDMYTVYGKVSKDELSQKDAENFKDFKKTRSGSEEFYPLLVGQYGGVICYKMKKNDDAVFVDNSL